MAGVRLQMCNKTEIQIDAGTGAVHLGSVVLGGESPLHLVRQAVEGHSVSERDIGNGYLWLSVQRLSLGGRPAGLSMCFNRDSLEMVTFGVSLPEDELIEGWPTEQTSMRQVKFMQKELERQLRVKFEQGNARLPWGSVWSRFDAKGFMATAGVAYGC